ncbi:MAG: Rpn family recombination-promoting nuclease/putative transposase [Erysipelotrichaceae bacterium]|nr:Rpn family recombination-promoting nuclease/putative transposase [Erysipelotrichaceae bacterium]
MIDLKKDINFRYVFGKNEEKNRMALSAMIQAFIGEKVEHLQIQSSELKMDMENAKETRMDILASFGKGEKIDIEMQMCNNKYELAQRMTFYAGQLISSQLVKGEDYSKVKKSYILFILDFKWIQNDDQLVHIFLKKDKWNNVLFETDYCPFVIVELPKVEYKKEMSVSEEYAFVLKYNQDERYRDIIEAIKKKDKGIWNMLECADQIRQDEKEWLKKIEEERNELDRNQKITNARLEGYEKGISDGEARGKAVGEARGKEETMNKNIRSMYKNGCDIEFIAKVLEQDIEYVENIITSNTQDKV